MTNQCSSLASAAVSRTSTGFRTSWILPVLAFAMAVCAAGCGTASSDEYEIVDASHTAESAVKSETKAPTKTVDESTQAGSAETVASNPGVNTRDETPEQVGSPEEVATVKTEEAGAGAETPGEVAPVNPEIVAGEPDTPEAVTEPTVIEPREVKLLVPERTFQEQGREKALRVTFDDVDLLKVLNMEPVQADAPKLMPSWLKGLDGQRIRLRGFMYPTFQDTDIEVFLLARDNDICCFGRSPKVYDIIKVSMKDGETTDYIQGRPFDVVGIFHIAEEAEIAKDALPKLYSMTDAVVISR